MELMKKTGVQEVESSPSDQDEQQVSSSFEWDDEQWNWRTDDQQPEFALMSPFDAFFPVPLNESGVSYNLLNKQPHRRTDPTA